MEDGTTGSGLGQWMNGHAPEECWDYGRLGMKWGLVTRRLLMMRVKMYGFVLEKIRSRARAGARARARARAGARARARARAHV